MLIAFAAAALASIVVGCALWAKPFRRPVRNLVRRVRRKLGMPQRYGFSSVAARTEADAAAMEGGALVVVAPEGHKKWALLECPCGCGELLALNLMRSHKPVWSIDVDAQGRPSIHPSVDATKCGSHFWLRQGRVTWCD